MAKKSISDLSADELFELARQKEEQEAAEAKEAVRAQIEELRARRRQAATRHRKELAAIDAEIRSLGGRTARGRRGGAAGISVTDAVMKIIKKGKKISTKEIKAELEKQGIEAQNLAQTLAYLKRQGRVQSPARSIYTGA